MTARSRWGIGVSAIAVVIIAVAFWDNARQKFGASPREDRPPLSGPSSLPPPEERGSFGTTQVGAAADGILKAVYVKEGQFAKKRDLTWRIMAVMIAAGLQLRQPKPRVRARQEPAPARRA